MSNERSIIPFGSLNTHEAPQVLAKQESTTAKNLRFDKVLGEIVSMGPFNSVQYPSGITSYFYYNAEEFVQCANKLYINGVEVLSLSSIERLSYVPVENIEGDTYLLINNVGGSYKYANGTFSNVGTGAPTSSPGIKSAMLYFDNMYWSNYTYAHLASSTQYRGISLDTQVHNIGSYAHPSNVLFCIFIYNYFLPTGEKVLAAPLSKSYPYNLYEELEDDGTVAMTYMRGALDYSDGLAGSHAIINNSYVENVDKIITIPIPAVLPNGSMILPEGNNIKFKMNVTSNLTLIADGAYTIVFSAGHLYTDAVTYWFTREAVLSTGIYVPALTEDFVIETFPVGQVLIGETKDLEFTLDITAKNFFGKGYESLTHIYIVKTDNPNFGTGADIELTVNNFGIYDADNVGTLNIDGAFYIYTYYNSVALTESDSSPVQDSNNFYNGVRTIDAKIGVDLIASTDPQIDKIRLYRLDSATGGAYKLVAELNNVDQTYWDDIDPGSLGATFTGDNNSPPTPGLKGLVYHNNKVFGFKDNILYNSENNNPEAWGDGVSNRTQIGDLQDILTCTPLGNTLVITKRESSFLYIINVSGNAPFSIQQIPIDALPVGTSAVSTTGGVIYLTADGLYKFNGFSSELISGPVTDKFNGNNGDLFKFNNDIYCTRPKVIVNQTLKVISEFDFNGLSVVSHRSGRLVYGLSNGEILLEDTTEGETFPFDLSYKTKDFLYDLPLEHKSIRRCTIEIETEHVVKVTATGSVDLTGTLIIDIGGELFEITESEFEIIHTVPHTREHNCIVMYSKDDKFSCDDLVVDVAINGNRVNKYSWYESGSGLFQVSGGYNEPATISYPLTPDETIPAPEWEGTAQAANPDGWSASGYTNVWSITLNSEGKRYLNLRTNNTSAINHGILLISPALAISLGTLYEVEIEFGRYNGSKIYLGDPSEKWRTIDWDDTDLEDIDGGLKRLTFEYTPTVSTNFGIYQAETGSVLKQYIYKISVRVKTSKGLQQSSRLFGLYDPNGTTQYDSNNPDPVYNVDLRFQPLQYSEDIFMKFYRDGELIYTKRLYNGRNDFSLPPHYKGKELSYEVTNRGGKIKINAPAVLKVSKR